jgi:hypothetical protein
LEEEQVYCGLFVAVEEEPTIIYNTATTIIDGLYSHNRALKPMPIPIPPWHNVTSKLELARG